MKQTASISWKVLVLLSGLLLSTCEALWVGGPGRRDIGGTSSVGQLTGEFKTVWNIPTRESLTLPLVDGGRYDFTVNWGDGSSTRVREWDSSKGSVTHDYAMAAQNGNKRPVTITGETFVGWRFVDATNAAKLIAVKSWGNMALGGGNVGGHFKGASNLDEFPRVDNVPDLRATTSLKSTFEGATNFNGDISAWIVSGITNMSSMFFGATKFNQDISDWDVSEVTNMQSMFNGATAFNNGGASGASNNPLTWNEKVQKVTNMSGMFQSAGAFNQDISRWDVRNVTTMQSMFNNASNFNQDISDWKPTNLDQDAGKFNTFAGSGIDGDTTKWPNNW